MREEGERTSVRLSNACMTGARPDEAVMGERSSVPCRCDRESITLSSAASTSPHQHYAETAIRFETWARVLQ